MSTVIIGLIVAAVLFLAARQIYKDKKSGKSSCGGNCAGCPHACSCHIGDCCGDVILISNLPIDKMSIGRTA